MKIRVGTLRKLISEAVNQMKLGVASANPPGEAWGVKDEPMPEDPGELTYIARDDVGRPEDKLSSAERDWYAGRSPSSDTTDMAGDRSDLSDRDMELTHPVLDVDIEDPFEDPFASMESGAPPYRRVG